MAFPTITGGGVTKLPAQRMTENAVRRIFFSDDSEQRWRTRLRVSRFMLKFTNISGHDVENIREFFTSAKGAFDTTWSIVFDGVTYSNCGFDQDDFPVGEPADFRTFYTFQLAVRQNTP